MYNKNLVFCIFQLLCFIIISAKCIPINNKDRQKCGLKLSSSNIYSSRSLNIENWPWQVHLKITDQKTRDYNHYPHCGSTILSDRWLLTAAHCLSDRKNIKIFILNDQNITKNTKFKEIKYESIIIHPNYKHINSFDEYTINDIALIKLNNRNTLSGNMPICLPEENSDLPKKAVCYIKGFAPIESDKAGLIKTLRDGKIVIRPDSSCLKSLELEFSSYDNRTMICGGTIKTADSLLDHQPCKGDSGGPLVCEGNYDVNGSSKWFVFGVTSFGAQDCAQYSNSVYTKVSSYVKWIRGITGITY